MSDTERPNDVGVIGVGVMGANLARNLASRGHRVAVHNRTPDTARRLAAEHPEAKLDVAIELEDLVARLERPRRLLVMVPAGPPVDSVLDALDPLLEADDVVIDGGNSLFEDTERRAERAAARPWRFFGMGVSGGEEGALRGPSLMPGGDEEAWERLREMLESIAAVSSSGPCVTYCGRRSAGHFVKMVHNGIEYGDMQLIAECLTLLRGGLGLDDSAVADHFAEWNRGELASFLIEITADILTIRDPEAPDRLLVDAILDSAGQKGTGRWTVQAAVGLGVAVPTIAAAVDARVLSADVALRGRAAERFSDVTRATLEGIAPGDVRQALYAAKIASYSQGFAMLAVASREHDYGTDLAEVARIWKAGCIIRAELLDDVRRAVTEAAGEPLALAPVFRDALAERLPAWRRVVAAASTAGIPVPGLAASLAWFETLTTARGSANLIQAQRDYFGAHTYERIDRPGEKLHTDWASLRDRRR